MADNDHAAPCRLRRMMAEHHFATRPGNFEQPVAATRHVRRSATSRACASKISRNARHRDDTVPDPRPCRPRSRPATPSANTAEMSGRAKGSVLRTAVWTSLLRRRPARWPGLAASDGANRPACGDPPLQLAASSLPECQASKRSRPAGSFAQMMWFRTTASAGKPPDPSSASRSSRC